MHCLATVEWISTPHGDATMVDIVNCGFAVLSQDKLDNSGMPSLHKIISVMAALYALLLVYQISQVTLLQQTVGAIAKLARWRMASALPGKRARHWPVDGRLLFGMLYKLKIKQWQERLTALGFSDKIETSSVERANLTMREMIMPIARRTWSLARSLETLTVGLEWGRCFYHFCRPHMGLAISRRRWRTPAMAVGLAYEVWSTERVTRYRLP
jgi:hypothetical protein